MPINEDQKQKPDGKRDPEGVPLSETISNAHSSGDGSIQLSEDGLIEPPGQTQADADANKELETKPDAY